ncbi:MAG: DNA repair protein RecN [Myxococcales bacterium]|nr:DNA repair protein RecN [Myxococcales bacterium]
MLSHLRVRQLAIISELEVAFSSGLNLVTGETGAGKSIIVAALQLVLGGRGRPQLVRTGAERAEVEALFDLAGDDAALRRVAGVLGLAEEELGTEIVVRRVLDAGGRSRAYVNGRLTAVAQLGALARGLVDISSQHEHHTLVDPATHLHYLDAFMARGGGAEPQGLHARMAAAWAVVATADAALVQLHGAVAEGRGDFLRFQLAELDRVADGPGLEAEILRLRHADRLGLALERAEVLLWSGDRSLTGGLATVLRDLAAAAEVDPALRPLLERVEGSAAELEDAGREIAQRRRGVRADPVRLAALEERLHELRRLRRRHGEDLAAAAALLRAEVARLDGAEARLALLEVARGVAMGEALAVAELLSNARRLAGTALGAAISAELASLGMGEARVDVAVSEAGLGASGQDRAEYLIATNRGEPPRPLAQVASGGELSRSLLAVKRVLAAAGPVGLYVFDEVDSGVGGAIADAIGKKLVEVARHHQVLCITHLPQIAAQPGHHFHVRKVVVGADGTGAERTESRIHRLSAAERVEEVARMLGGAAVTVTTRAAAQELLL